MLASPALAAYDPDPDYFFHWLRDSAVVIDALRVLIEEGDGGPGAIDLVGDFVRFSLALGELDGRDLLRPGIRRRGSRRPIFSNSCAPTASSRLRSATPSRAKRGSIRTGRWTSSNGRARNTTARRCARSPSCGSGGSACSTTPASATRRVGWSKPISRSPADAGATPSFDIWEEELGHHYYTRLVQSAALGDGAQWLDAMGDAARADESAARRRAKSPANSMGIGTPRRDSIAAVSA